jgi:hypothetical protein
MQNLKTKQVYTAGGGGVIGDENKGLLHHFKWSN